MVSYMYIHTYTYTLTHKYTHTYTLTHKYTHTYTYTYVLTYLNRRNTLLVDNSIQFNQIKLLDSSIRALGPYTYTPKW